MQVAYLDTDMRTGMNRYMRESEKRRRDCRKSKKAKRAEMEHRK